MKIDERPISYYIERMQRDEYFALPGYSDAEWYSMVGYAVNQRTGLGQVMTAEVGNKLTNVICSRHNDPRFMFAVPKCLWEMDDCVTAGVGTKIDKFVITHGLTPTFVERDMITDDMAKNALMHPFITQIRKMHTVLIGNKFLDKMTPILGLNQFVDISSPNLHTEPNGGLPRIERLFKNDKQKGKLFLISAGVSAPLIIYTLYRMWPDNFYFDCGSIWDAFAGIGSQRGWRRELFSDPAALLEWRRKNLDG